MNINACFRRNLANWIFQNACNRMSIMKTIICADYQKEFILRADAAKTGGISAGLQAKSLRSLLHEETDDLPSLLLQLHILCQKNMEDFKIYGKMFCYPAFLKEVLSFAKECVVYGIDADELPGRNDQEKELRHLIRLTLSLDLAEKTDIPARDRKAEEIVQTENISVFPWFEKDTAMYRIMTKIMEKIPSADISSSGAQKHLRYALNPRQEIEAIAQDIVKNGKECMIIMTTPETQLPVIRQVFSRYQIPFSSLSEHRRLHIPGIFSALVRLAVEKDADAFINAVQRDAFPVFCPPQLITYFSRSLTAVDIPHVSDMIGEQFPREKKYTGKMEEKAAVFFGKIDDDLQSLLQAEDGQDALTRAYKVMQRSPFLESKEELAGAAAIRSSLMESMDLLNDPDNLRFFLRTVESQEASVTISESDFCIVTDLTHTFPSRPDTYIIGCSGTAFPGFKAASGLFDENYLAAAEKYPSLQERYDAYMKQLSWIYGSASEHLYFSNATNDYQGRSVEFAFEAESLFPAGSAQKWPLLSQKRTPDLKHELDPETAEKLFARDGSVHGSISTIERWFACPYAYFLSSGLSVRADEVADLDARTTGELVHAVLEHAVKTYGKEYTEMQEKEIREILEENFRTISLMAPHRAFLHEISRERLFHEIQVAMDFLHDFESCTSFVPTETEYPFDDEITEGVKLHGIIDRVDMYPNLLRIVDYKSSTHTLSPSKILAGLQLQLLSYALVAEKKFEVQPAGAYYFSLKEEGYDVIAAKRNRKVIEDTDWSEEAEKERMLKARMLKGWTFLDRFTELDDGEKHISLKKNLRDFDAVKECVVMLYDYFRDHLLSGEIPLDPVDGACTFCDNRPVCRFHGTYRPVRPVVDSDLGKGGKE